MMYDVGGKTLGVDVDEKFVDVVLISDDGTMSAGGASCWCRLEVRCRCLDQGLSPRWLPGDVQCLVQSKPSNLFCKNKSLNKISHNLGHGTLKHI